MTSAPDAIASTVACAAARSWSPRSSMDPSRSIRTACRPAASSSARYRRSCSKPRLRMMSSSGSARIGRSTRPAMGGPLELGQVFACEVRDEIGGGVDRSAVDRLHASDLSRSACQLACQRFAVGSTCESHAPHAGRRTTGRTDLGEPHRPADPRGDRARRLRRAAAPGRAAAARGRHARRRPRDGLPDAPRRGLCAAVDRGRQGSAGAARAAR